MSSKLVLFGVEVIGHFPYILNIFIAKNLLLYFPYFEVLRGLFSTGFNKLVADYDICNGNN